MSLYEKIRNREEKLSVIGLGYVGLPLAVSFAKVADVIGFDISEKKITSFKSGIDVTKEVGDEALKAAAVCFTNKEDDLKKAKFHIVAVPTPIHADKTPNLRPVISACEILGRNLTPGSVAVFESTVYPGVTEEICVPILEKASGLVCGRDFKVGYSPERINPGDRLHRLDSIVKVVSGMDVQTLETVADIYGMVVKAGIHKAESIKVAEAAKVIENAQRDINIAFMNELSIIFNILGIDTKAVLQAARTKWNFLDFTPGLVGGHCIGVDPYYLTYRAEAVGYHSQIILAGRKINDQMGKYVAENTVKLMIKANKQIKGAKVAVLGLTFKENCPDVRNTKVVDIIRELWEYGVETVVHDPEADPQEVYAEYGITLTDLQEISQVDAVILAVPHRAYLQLSLADIGRLYNGRYTHVNGNNACDDKKVFVDVKGVFDRQEAEESGCLYWRL